MSFGITNKVVKRLGRSLFFAVRLLVLLGLRQLLSRQIQTHTHLHSCKLAGRERVSFMGAIASHGHRAAAAAAATMDKLNQV